MIFIEITEECNLSCKYCYITHNKGILNINSLEQFLIYLKGYNLILEQEEICFIGGEPLLYKNRLKESIELVKKMLPKVEISIFSNLAFNFNEIKEVIIDQKIKIYTSIDGTKTSHDRIRRLKEGSSYDLVIENLKELSKVKNQIEIIYTFDPDFKDQSFIEFIEAVLKINSDPNKWRFNIRPSYPYANFKNCSWYIEEGKKLTKYWIDQYKKGEILRISLISAGLNIINQDGSAEMCGMGDSLLVLKPNGDIWPCNQYYRIKKRKLGNINENTFKEIEKERNKIRLFKSLLHEKFSEKNCDCFVVKSCNGVPCPASFEENEYHCDEHQKVAAKMVEEITFLLKKHIPIDQLKKIKIRGSYLE